MDKALKQRLVGASVIIALAVIVLPMLLSGRPESGSGQTQVMEIPPRPDELSFETRRFPVTDDEEGSRPGANPASAGATIAQVLPELPTAKNAANGENGDAVAASPGAVEISAPEAGPAVTPESVAVSSPEAAADQQATDTGQGAPAPVIPAETSSPAVQAGSEAGPASSPPVQAGTVPGVEGGDRYVVQVASLSSAENANRLESRLKKQGFSVLRDTVESELGRLDRVRVGPFATETEAAEVSASIKKGFEGVSPRVVDLQPGLTAPVTNPNDPLVRWVVQLGVFNDSGNAKKLVDRLRSDGMTAYSETITAKPTTTYRVRVGPFLEHDEAIRTQQQLSERQKINGVVMTAD